MTADLLSAIVLLEPGEQASNLEETLLSLAVQEFFNTQIIVVGDTSQIDDVKAVAQNQQFLPTMQFEALLLPGDLKDNNANRLNTALNHVRGQFVSILQSNDIVYGFAFEKLIRVLKQCAEPVVVAGTRNAYRQADGYIVNKLNHSRAGKKTFDVWFDEECARNFVIDKERITGNLITEPSLDYFETYFLLLALSLHNEFNFSLAGESLFERRQFLLPSNFQNDSEKLRLRARSKVIDWRSAQLSGFRTASL